MMITSLNKTLLSNLSANHGSLIHLETRAHHHFIQKFAGVFNSFLYSSPSLPLKSFISKFNSDLRRKFRYTKSGFNTALDCYFAWMFKNYIMECCIAITLHVLATLLPSWFLVSFDSMDTILSGRWTRTQQISGISSSSWWARLIQSIPSRLTTLCMWLSDPILSPITARSSWDSNPGILLRVNLSDSSRGNTSHIYYLRTRIDESMLFGNFIRVTSVHQPIWMNRGSRSCLDDVVWPSFGKAIWF